jgi:probable rRNA maturation factor
LRINIFSENIHKNIEVDEKKAISVAQKILTFYLNEEIIFNQSCLKDKDNGREFNCISFDILYCDNEKTHQINKEYRGKDYPADIITFAIFADSEEKFIFDGEINLGEIIISLDKVLENAEEKGKGKREKGKEAVSQSEIRLPFTVYRSPFEAELDFLIAHGIMHLLGFDHQTNEEYTFIMKAQSDALKSCEVQHEE